MSVSKELIHEAVANVEVVIDEWIETAIDLGRTVPGPRGHQTLGSR